MSDWDFFVSLSLSPELDFGFDDFPLSLLCLLLLLDSITYLLVQKSNQCNYENNEW